MEVGKRNEVAKCTNPRCQHPIPYLVHRFKGGINDRGGWVLKCSSCGNVFGLQVTNPNESRLLSGATILDYWDDEIGNRSEVLAAHAASNDPERIERIMITEHGEPESFYDTSSKPLYTCAACNESLEQSAYEAITSSMGEVARGFAKFRNTPLASSGPDPDGAIIQLNFVCVCGKPHQARFYREHAESTPRKPEDMWLVDVLGDGPVLDVDGIYTRDECISILEKLLLRWRAMHSAVLLAAPFIGFNYPGAKERIPNLWNWLLKYTDHRKTSLVTRRATFNLMKAAASATENDIEFLKSWGILNPTIARLEEKSAFFKTDFHAKFYCGMSFDSVEVLVGSFNIHEGSYVENIHLLTYSLEDFCRRYLFEMNMFFDINSLKRSRDIVEIVLRDGVLEACNRVSRSGSLLNEGSAPDTHVCEDCVDAP